MNRKTASPHQKHCQLPLKTLSSREKIKGEHIHFDGVLWNKVVLNVQLHGLWTKSNEVFTQMKYPNLPALLHH